MPLRQAKLPSEIASQPNGAVDAALLDVVDRPGKTWLMAKLPAQAMRAMHAAIKRDLGVTLTSTGRGRTLARQWTIFGGSQARYRPCSKQEFDADKARHKELTKLFPANDRRAISQRLGIAIPSSDHWTKIRFSNGNFPATAAVPGTSNHGFWCADDLALTDPRDENKVVGLTNDVLDWLFTNELDFGFAHSTPSENWHVQWFVGDRVPQPTTADPREDDMARAFKISDNDAVFLVSGIVASWVPNREDYAVAVAAKLAPPLDHVEVVRRSTFSALRLVGAIPPGFTTADFQEVVGGQSSNP
jgi:hypothetical protein